VLFEYTIELGITLIRCY